MILPGWLVFRAISPGTRSRAWQLALGWPLGLVLEVFAFSLTAALGVRDAFFAYPVIVAVPAILLMLRRRGATVASVGKPERPEGLPRACTGALVGLFVLGVGYLWLAYFEQTPLPGSVPSVYYNSDVIFHLSLAGEALHHWPIADPRVTGEPFPYHYLGHIHIAAISQVTGIELPVVLFRLYLVPLLGLVVLQLGVFSAALTRRAWAGPISVALFLLIGELDLSIVEEFPFLNSGTAQLWSTPTLLAGVVLLLPSVFCLCALLDPELRAAAEERGLVLSDRALWGILTLTLAGAGLAKTAIPPLLIGGLVVFLAWRWLGRRSLDRTALRALALCVMVEVAYLIVLYGTADYGLHFVFGGSLLQMSPILRMQEALPDSLPLEVLFWSAAAPIGALMFCGAALLGIGWALRGHWSRLPPADALLLSLPIAGLIPFYLTQQDGTSQIFALLYAIPAVLPLAAAGLMRLLAPRHGRTRWPVLLAFAVGLGGALAVLALSLEDTARGGHPLRADLLAYGSAVAVPLAIAVAAFAAKGVRRTELMAFAVAAALAAAAINYPLDVLVPSIRKASDDLPQYFTEAPGAISYTPEADEGLRWIRDHTDEDAVLAISDDRDPSVRGQEPLHVDYQAFSERHTLLEGWGYSQRSGDLGYIAVFKGERDPFPERRELERRVFQDGDASAARELAERYGLTHLVIDRRYGAAAPGAYELGRLVFSNERLDVIELSPEIAG